jgi:hypothetical protein
LIYDEAGVLTSLDTVNSFPGSPVPGLFNTDKNSQTGSIIGPQWNWNKYNKYCDVSDFTELVVAVTLKKEDIGKEFTFRYAFSTSSEDVEGGSVITNRSVTIDQEEMLLVIDLNNDTADVEDLKHLGAIKFQTVSEELWFVVDYVALKKVGVSSEARLESIKLNDIGLFGFDSDVYTYDLGVKLSSVTVTATPMDENADVEITGDGNIDLSSGSATVLLTVTAEDGSTTKVYTLNIVKSSGVENIQESEMTVYPTISNGSFNIVFSQIPGSITVFNLTGNVVMQKTILNLTEEISLNSGVYFIKLETDRASKIVKVICTHR